MAGALIEEPEHLKVLFAKPGSEWTDSDRECVCSWLFEPQQLVQLLVMITHWLGSGTSSQDAEDAFDEFFLRLRRRRSRTSAAQDEWVYSLWRTILLYDPRRGPFLPYMLLGLKRFAFRFGNAIRHDQASRVSIVSGDDDDKQSLVEDLPDCNDCNKPEEALLGKEMVEAFSYCVDRLPEQQRAVIIQHYYEERSYCTIAEMLGITEVNARVIKCRALLALRSCVERRGFVP